MLLDDALVKSEQISDFLLCMEDALVDAAHESGMSKPMKTLHSLFYIMMDQFQVLSEELEKANGHLRVLSVVHEVNRTEELKEENAQLKKEIERLSQA